MSKSIIKLFMALLFIVFSHHSFAIDPNDPFNPGTPVVPSPAPPNAIPIDGGLSWLLAAGGIYGVSKLRKNLKK